MIFEHPKDVSLQTKWFSNIQKMSMYKQNDFWTFKRCQLANKMIFEHPKDVFLNIQKMSVYKQNDFWTFKRCQCTNEMISSIQKKSVCK